MSNEHNGRNYITFKHAFFGLAALVASTASILVWANSEHKDYVPMAQYQSMEDDIRIIKECLIQKRCG